MSHPKIANGLIQVLRYSRNMFSSQSLISSHNSFYFGSLSSHDHSCYHLHNFKYKNSPLLSIATHTKGNVLKQILQQESIGMKWIKPTTATEKDPLWNVEISRRHGPNWCQATLQKSTQPSAIWKVDDKWYWFVSFSNTCTTKMYYRKTKTITTKHTIWCFCIYGDTP